MVEIYKMTPWKPFDLLVNCNLNVTEASFVFNSPIGNWSRYTTFEYMKHSLQNDIGKRSV